MEKVSVIITNYNHEKYLEKRIESVLAQTFEDYTIAIYDDCSTDDSRNIIERYRGHPKVVSINYNDRNSGSLYLQFERAVSEAAGEWIWKAESDDYAKPEFLRTLLPLAESHENVGIAFCGSYWVDDSGAEGADLSLYNTPFFRTGGEEIRQKLVMQCSVQNASAAILRTDIAKAVIRGIGRYSACGDWVFYERMLCNSNIVFTPEKLNYFRWYHNNVSNTAMEDGTWITEGIDVLRNVDHNKVEFSYAEYFKAIKWWLWLVRRSPVKTKWKLYGIITYAAIKFICK